MLNGVSNVFGKLGSYIYIYSSLVLLFISSIIISNLLVDSTFADNLDYSVTVSPSLNVTISANSILLNLNPNNKTFDSKNLNITVATNNPTGYELTMSSNSTDLPILNSKPLQPSGLHLSLPLAGIM